jgi:hypothetical protein
MFIYYDKLNIEYIMQRFMRSICIILVIFVIINLIMTSRSLIFVGSLAYALSPSDAQQIRAIIRQELRNMFNSDNKTSNTINGEFQEPLDNWINTFTSEYTRNGQRDTDIQAVDYSNNGRFLNATLWIRFPFRLISTNEHVDYGMLIDSDFNKNTGYGGIDYNLQLSWNNETKLWSRTLYQWSPAGEQMTLESNKNITKTNILGTSGIRGLSNYVILSLDLNSVRHQDKYEVAFYAQSQRYSNSSYISDFTKWVTFPPLSVDISTSPPFLTLRPGEQKTIEVKVNSTRGYEPEVSVGAVGQPGIKTEFNMGSNLTMPTYGMATAPLTISAGRDVPVGQYTIVIDTNSTIKSPSVLRSPEVCRIRCDYRESLSKIGYPIIPSHSSLTASVLPPLTLSEQLAVGTINPQIAAGLYGLVAAPIIAWLIPRILESFNVQ